MLRTAVAEKAFPGGVLAIGGATGVARLVPVGRLTYEPESPAVTAGTLYDLASLTKVVATTAAAMLLVDEGRLDLDAPVSAYIPAFSDGAKGGVTVRQLLSHSAGLPAWAPLYREVRGKDALVSRVTAIELEYVPGTRSQYGDLAMILLASVIEKVSSEPFEPFVQRRVLQPLGMENTLFRPGPGLQSEIAPTEEDRWRGRLLRGEVHDENAYAMGGVAGHAGLFGTAGDLARLAQAMLNRGQVGSTQWLTPRTIQEFTTRAGVPGSSRALGWDTPGTDAFLGGGWSETSYGHTGLTGTLLWIDPARDFFVVLLTNRIYPSRDNEAFSGVRSRVCERLLSASGH